MILRHEKLIVTLSIKNSSHDVIKQIDSKKNANFQEVVSIFFSRLLYMKHENQVVSKLKND